MPTACHGKTVPAEWVGDCARAVVAPSSPQTLAQAAASLVEAATTGEGQEAEAEGKKEKRTRRKDPAAPKKALTAYLVFINSKREQIIKEHPTADLKDQVTTSLVLLFAVNHPLYTSSCLHGHNLLIHQFSGPHAVLLHAFPDIIGTAVTL